MEGTRLTYPLLFISASKCMLLFPGAEQASITFIPGVTLLTATGRQLACTKTHYNSTKIPTSYSWFNSNSIALLTASI